MVYDWRGERRNDKSVNGWRHFISRNSLMNCDWDEVIGMK